jgi:hypothetical protein
MCSPSVVVKNIETKMRWAGTAARMMVLRNTGTTANLTQIT